MSGGITGLTGSPRTEPELEKAPHDSSKNHSMASSFARAIGAGPGATMIGGELVSGPDNARIQSQGGGMGMTPKGSMLSKGGMGAADAATQGMGPMAAIVGSNGASAMENPNSTASKLIHTGLDLGGMVPGLGTVTEGANAALYAKQGDLGDAALSGLSAIPEVGDITDAGRLGKDVLGLTKTA